MLWLFAQPTGVYLLDFFCSSIQFYLLLSPYLCFIFLLYLDTYVLGRDRSGSVVEYLTQDRRAAGSSLTGVTALWTLQDTFILA